MTIDFESETAIVTGAASGIGRATAERFAAEGANVVVSDVDADGGRETVERIESDGGTATFVETDVSDADAVEAMFAEAVDAYGSLDVAVNNAGVEGEADPLAEVSEAAWFPAALLPDAGVEWAAVGDRSARATLRDRGNSASLVFHFDDEGVVERVTATERYRQEDHAPWTGRFGTMPFRSLGPIPAGEPAGPAPARSGSASR